MKKTMKALRIYEPYKQQIDEVEIPQITDGEVLIKVLGCGICAGDIKTLHGGQKVWGATPEEAYIETPCISGHEFFGEVVEIGKDIEGIQIGDTVTAEQILPCGECKYCRHNKPWMCKPHTIYGFKQNAQGGFAEYMKFAKGSIIHKLPKELTVEQAALVEPYSCAMNAAERGEILHTDVVVVSGLGTLGLGIVSAAKKNSPKLIIGLDLKETKRNKALEFGADIVFDPTKTDVVKEIMDLTEGYGCDVYIEAVGSEVSVTQGLNMISSMGRFVQFGVFPKNISADWNIIGDSKAIDIHGAHLSGHCYAPVIKGIADGTLKTNGVVTHIFKLDEWEKAFETAQKDESAIKVVLVP